MSAHPPGVYCTFARRATDVAITRLFASLAVPPGSKPLVLEGGPDLAHARNEAIKRAMVVCPEWAWLLFIDGDQAVREPATLVSQLLGWQVDVVSALVAERRFPHPLNAFVEVDPERLHGTRLSYDVLPDDGLVKVAAVGMGCCLVRRAAVERVGAFRVGMGDPQSDRQREDVDWTWRATQAGLGVHVDVGCCVLHAVDAWVTPGRLSRRPFYEIATNPSAVAAWDGRPLGV